MTTQKIELKQREHLVDLLSDARSREVVALESKLGADENAIATKLAKENGCDKLVKGIRDGQEHLRQLETLRDQYRREISDRECEIKRLGFELQSDGTFDLCYGAPHGVAEAVRSKVAILRAPVEKVEQKYRSAEARLWSAATHEELAKTVEGLI